MGIESHIPTRPCMQETAEQLLPGSSLAVQRMREQALDFSSSMTARSVLLRGPIGSGKSTLARLLGLLKRVAPLRVDEAERILADKKFDRHHRIDLRYIPWYLELTLTGLVEGLAEVQLFGATKGAYTGAGCQRAGVFEQASTGRSRKGEEHDAAKLTGGVVFLDEVGDLAASLQAKLLPALSGAPFYRIGGEGNLDHELEFHGITITASWRSLNASVLRPDLLSRISAYVIDVPGLSDREADFDVVLNGIQTSVMESMRRAIDEADKVEPALDRQFWRGRKGTIRPLSSADCKLLRGVDWGRHGNLRGLRAAVEQIIGGGRSTAVVVNDLPLVQERSATAPANQGHLLPWLLEGASANGKGLAWHLRELELKHRSDFRERLLEDPAARGQLATKMGVTEQQLLSQIRDLARTRRKGEGDES